MTLIKTPLAAEIAFLIAMLLGQLAVIAGANAPRVIGALIVVKAITALINLLSERERDSS